MYGHHDTFPITGVGKAETLPKGTANVNLGSVRFAVETDGDASSPAAAKAAQVVWLDQFPDIQVSYTAGLARWVCRHPGLGVELKLEIRPNVTARGLIARVTVAKAPAGARLQTFYGALGFYGMAGVNDPNKIDLRGSTIRMTSPALPRAISLFGLDQPEATAELAPGYVFDVNNEALTPIYDSKTVNLDHPCVRVSTSLVTGQVLHAIAVWGADGYDPAKMEATKKRLSLLAIAQPYYDKVWNTWFGNFIGKQLEPEQKFNKLMADPKAAWQTAEEYGQDRAARWSIHTPDKALNAAGNWAGQTLEYFRQPPGYMLGYLSWQGFGHITTGWYPLLHMGDGEKLAIALGTFAGTRLGEVKDFMDKEKIKANKKEIPWVFLNLETTVSEPLNAPFIDHVWNLWQWTGDEGWLRALWPAVRDAIEGEMAIRDPDGDGLYHGFYEFWDCDAEQRGPKAAAETGWMISGLRSAARMAEALGYKEEAQKYRQAAERSDKAWQAQLWWPETGQCTGRTGDDQRYERASIHEVFIPALRGVMSEKQAAQALRRLRYLTARPAASGTPLMFKNDVWPILWSQHYMPPGDISMTYMAAAARCGLGEEYFPCLTTVCGRGDEHLPRGPWPVGRAGRHDGFHRVGQLRQPVRVRLERRRGPVRRRP